MQGEPMTCPKCGADNERERIVWRAGAWETLWKCEACGWLFDTSDPSYDHPDPLHKPTPPPVAR